VYVRQQKAAENADLVLDGMLPAEVLARQVVTRARAAEQVA
jgi:hypothetical protein